ncbi:2-methylaconitate cis-trans isomerase PrpF [Vibrio aquaticus]|uniref:2-methylaconitate cis-trans isomerase PrpF n=1 Tax=Vibrio aquaticus TaxID=2496559 RepID=A0A432CWC4_9VIBR|nr:2-methylaconitate cis-trans isomerase PrpF [Vibrio aquaticus]RTZ14518.1 2-methylaconitate cis-trans isomerase PrpF [Vibrio aquaticus]
MTRKPLNIPATYMRGGTSKGVIFSLRDLPTEAQTPGEYRDALFLRVIGSPDPYSKQIDGMGGATSSTSKTAIVSKSERPDHDVDYLFGQVSIDKPFVDWSGNCGNLSAAIGPFAIHAGLVNTEKIPENGIVEVKVWQQNISKTIVVHVPISNGVVQESGDFFLDGVAFPSAEIQVDFVQPGASDGAMFPTGNLIDSINIDGIGELEVTLIDAGIPTVFVDAAAIGYQGTELQEAINGDSAALEQFELIRAHGALKMGLISELGQAKERQHTPKVAFVSQPKRHTTSSGKVVEAHEVDILVRALSMGKLHHAMMGTAAVSIAAAASVPGTLVHRAAGEKARSSITFGHPSGTLKVGAKAISNQGSWTVEKASMSRSARVIMEGCVRVPFDCVPLGFSN